MSEKIKKYNKEILNPCRIQLKKQKKELIDYFIENLQRIKIYKTTSCRVIIDKVNDIISYYKNKRDE